MKQYFPFLSWLPLAKKHWKDDFIAGVSVMIIVIPQAVAFAMIAGLPPIYGFYSAIFIPIITALFGSSYHLISGPTTAISIIVLAAVSPIVSPSNVHDFVALVLLLTFMAGIIQFLLGVFKFGKFVHYISNTVLIGFAAGIGVLIAFNQLKYVFDISMPTGVKFFEIITIIFQQISETNIYTLGVALSTLFVALFIKIFLKPISKYFMLIALLVGSVLTFFLGSEAHHIVTVSAIKLNFSSFFNIHSFNFENLKKLLLSAFIVAFVGLVKSIAIGKTIAQTTNQKINSNQEFIGLGLANMIGSFFSAYAGDGSFTRSKINQQAGAKTPLSSVFSAILLLLVLIFGAKYATYLPKSAMASIIMFVGFSLIDFTFIKKTLNESKTQSIVLFSTLLSTLFLSLGYALLIGVSLSFLLKSKDNKLKG